MSSQKKTNRKRDIYDEAVEYLTRHPKLIYSAWQCPDGTETRNVRMAHCLFQYVSPTGNKEPYHCGCLTEIKDGIAVAHTLELTKAIHNDKRLPGDECLIRVKHLPLFARWQRRIDKMLGRKPPMI